MKRHLVIFFAAWTLLSLGCNQGPWNSGDRVLVSKFLHDTELAQPKRYDVVVFKYPVRPIEKGVPKNYIKRLLGLPGQLLAILFGRLFFIDPEGDAPLFPEPKTLTTKDGKIYKGFLREEDDKKVIFQIFKHDRVLEGKETRPGDRFYEQTFDKGDIASIQPIPMAERWKHRLPGSRFHVGDMEPEAEMNETDLGNDFDFMLEDHPWAYEWYRRGKLQVMRKPPDVMLAMRRVVFDNDFQPKDLVGERFQRWLPKTGSAWKSDSPTTFVTESRDSKGVDWMRYRHLVLEGKGDGPRLGVKDPAVRLITDVYSYNKVKMGFRPDGPVSQSNWVGDLMLECTLEVTEAKGEFWMELSRGIDRFRARFDLASGQCTLYRESDGKDPVELASRPTTVNSKGAHQIRFANFGARLTVWVDRDLPFEQGHDYDPPEIPRPGEFKDLDDDAFAAEMAKRRGPTRNDFEPASLGVSGAAVQVKGVRLWRDTYYSRTDEYSGDLSNVQEETWSSFRRLAPKTYYVQPNHYMVLGDNSTMSSDSRDWGLVPDRLMLGRAHMVYFPFNRAGPIK